MLGEGMRFVVELISLSKARTKTAKSVNTESVYERHANIIHNHQLTAHDYYIRSFTLHSHAAQNMAHVAISRTVMM